MPKPVPAAHRSFFSARRPAARLIAALAFTAFASAASLVSVSAADAPHPFPPRSDEVKIGGEEDDEDAVGAKGGVGDKRAADKEDEKEGEKEDAGEGEEKEPKKPPETRVETVVDTLHTVAFEDDYRWLEDQDAAETRAWIVAQNEYAETVIGESPLRDRIRATLRRLVDRPDVGTPRKAGDFEYFTMRRTGEEMERLYRRPAPAEAAGRSEAAGTPRGARRGGAGRRVPGCRCP